MVKNNGLFRQDVLEERKRLHGDVLLVQPISFYFLSTLLAAIVLLTISLLFWGSYARSELVPGYLVPTKGQIKILPHRGGIISNIYVEQDDHVSAGDSLVLMQMALATPEGITPEARSLELIGEQQQTLENQLALEEISLNLLIGQLTAEQTSLKTELEALLGQLSAQSSMTVLSNTSFKDAQLLQRSRNISGTEVDRRQQAYLTDLRQQNALKQQLISARSRIEQLGFQIERAPVDSAQRVTDLRNRIASLARQQAELEGREGYLLTAPVSGTITALNFHIGRTVDARTPLLAIMPEGSVLEAELFVPSRAIGFIDEGQEVRLLFDAFPYQRFGSFPAEIKAVSGAVMAPEESGAPFALNEATYRVLARLDEQSLLIADSSVALQSGMKLTANIVLERRSFMDWLLEPLRAVARRS